MPRSGPGSGRGDKVRKCRGPPSPHPLLACVHLFGEAALSMGGQLCFSYCQPDGLSSLGHRLRSGDEDTI